MGKSSFLSLFLRGLSSPFKLSWSHSNVFVANTTDELDPLRKRRVKVPAEFAMSEREGQTAAATTTTTSPWRAFRFVSGLPL